jgi:fumarylacetoacetate (FAA) hydrolase
VRLATLRNGGRDGTLAVVAPDWTTAMIEPGGIRTLQDALDDWASSEPLLRDAYASCVAAASDTVRIDVSDLHSPLPRAYQWCDSSSYLTHMERIRAARGMALPPDYELEPIAYQAGSDVLLAPTDPIALGDEAWGLDLEPEVAVVTDDVPMGTSPADAAAHIKLVLLANDITLRHVIPLEYAKGVGPYLAKPARAFAPFARTPDGLGDAWDGALLHASVRCTLRGELLGEVRPERDCAFDFPTLIAYLTRTRSLGAGSIIGGGTISNRDPAAGSSCIAERRAVERLANDEATTPFLEIGDRITIEARSDSGESLFGAIDQRVIPSSGPPSFDIRAITKGATI